MKKLQKGRSMIEMLGVLAIIGVLSIGGLAGYTMAMNRHRANTVLDFAQRALVTAQTAGDNIPFNNVACTDDSVLKGETQPAALASTNGCVVTKTNGLTTVEVTFSAQPAADAFAQRAGITGTIGLQFHMSDENNTWEAGAATGSGS